MPVISTPEELTETMWEDPIVTEVCRIRDELAEQDNFDVGTVFAGMRKRQSTLGPRLVRREKQKGAEQAAAPDRDSAALHPGR